MANEEHVKIVKQGKEAIAKWRVEHPGEAMDLRDAGLRCAGVASAVPLPRPGAKRLPRLPRWLRRPSLPPTTSGARV